MAPDPQAEAPAAYARTRAVIGLVAGAALAASIVSAYGAVYRLIEAGRPWLWTFDTRIWLAALPGAFVGLAAIALLLGPLLARVLDAIGQRNARGAGLSGALVLLTVAVLLGRPGLSGGLTWALAGAAGALLADRLQRMGRWSR